MVHTVEYTVGSRRGSVSVRDGPDWQDRLAAAVAAEAGLACLRHLSDAPGPDPLDRLTPRQREVVLLLAQGVPQLQIAARLGIGNETVRNHVAGVRRRLGLVGATKVGVLVELGLLGRPGA